MSDMSWEHASEARAALNAIVTDPEHGVAALSNAQTMSNLLKDYLPDAPREKSILVAAAEAGLADTLRDHVSQGMDPNTAIRLTASSFSSSTPFTPEACNWVTDELAVALGISQPRQPGSAQPAGGAPGGAGVAGGNEGMPTRMAPIPGAAPDGGTPGGFGQPQPANQGPGQGYPQAPAPGFGAPAQPNPQDQPTAQGYRPGYAPGPQQGGFGQPQRQAYPGQPPQPQPQPYQAQAQRFPGQPVQPYPGQQPQPQPYQAQQAQQAQPGRGYPGQPGFVQPGQPGTPAGWTPTGGYAPGGGFGPPSKPTGGRRGLLVGGGIIVLVIIVIVAAVFLTKKPSKHNLGGGGGGSPTATATTPSTSNTPTPSGGIEPLRTIMNPVGFKPVGTDCIKAFLLGLKASTITSRIFCGTTTKKNIEVWGYQFDNNADYLAGFAHINSFTGFHQSSPNTGCRTPVETSDGSSLWNANSNPKYVKRPGQVLECFLDNGSPLVVWTMPTMNVFFIGRDTAKSDTVAHLVAWWETLNYG
ncbi:MAG TPA: hypothetical protein VN695_00100 [Streptosporangiaceae bacterium]|nr:hypothetical protein [Streptosporangiaceae bacterium]